MTRCEHVLDKYIVVSHVSVGDGRTESVNSREQVDHEHRREGGVQGLAQRFCKTSLPSQLILATTSAAMMNIDMACTLCVLVARLIRADMFAFDACFSSRPRYHSVLTRNGNSQRCPT